MDSKLKQTKKSTLTSIATRKSGLEMQFLSYESVKWLQAAMRELRAGGTAPAKFAKEIVNEKDRRTTKFLMGGLYHFFYDAKGKNDLPYWDMFPLVIPLKRDGQYFTGLNLHYLPPVQRAFFLDKLMDLVILNDDNEPKRLAVTYDILKAVNSYSEFKPCLKQYLISHVKSRIVEVRPFEWETCIFLPTQMFKGASANKVYKESMELINQPKV